MISSPLLLLLFLPFVSALSNFPVVQTSYGPVRGYEYRSENGFVGEIFKKIPFAAPPIGSRRWKKPVPPQTWNYTIDGTFFGPACAQGDHWAGYVTGFSEDCLTLNVYTSKDCRESASCPVVVYIHGGFGLFDGTMMFPDETMVTNFASQGVIMVTVAYRLGVFGVMALGDENVLPANLAVHDVLESLRFINKEIHSFGGDKDQISVMGHSTGATIILMLSFSPGISRPGDPPLFARAIAMSGTANFQSEEVQVAKSHDAAKMLGCSGSAQEIVDCLLPLSTEEIVNGTSEIRLTDNTLAGELMPIQSVKELRQIQRPLKLLLGTTVNEFEYAPISELKSNLTMLCPKEPIDGICEIVGVRNMKECSQKVSEDCQSGKFDPGYNVVSQGTYISNWLFAKAQVEAGGEVYLYQYDYPIRSRHADDIYYVMGFHEHPMDSNEQWLSRVYPVYITNFIKGLPLAPDWKPFDPELMNYYSINKSLTDGVSPRMKLGYHRTTSEYYEGILKFDENLTTMKKQMLNSPVQYKNSTVTMVPESFSLFHTIFYSVVIVLLLFLVYKSVRFCRQKSEEETPLVMDRSTSVQSMTSEV